MLHIDFSCITESLLRRFDHAEILTREFGQSTSLIAEMSSYLREPPINYRTANHAFERIQYLNKFPIIKELYLKYNCILQTEADVERIFSFAGRFFLICIVFCAVQYFSQIVFFYSIPFGLGL